MKKFAYTAPVCKPVAEEERIISDDVIVRSWHEMYKGSVAEEIVSDFIEIVKGLMPKSRDIVMMMIQKEIGVYNYRENQKKYSTNT